MKNKVALCLSSVFAFGAMALASPPDQHAMPQELLSTVANGTETEPFSFVYDGKSSREILPAWERKQETRMLSGNRELRVTTYRDRRTGLVITDQLTRYKNFHAVEWVLRFTNTGSKDTPIIEELNALDLGIDPPGMGGILVHSVNNSLHWANPLVQDFVPSEERVSPGAAVGMVHYEMKGEDPVDGGQLPYFDLQWQEGGLIGAVGWTGQWAIQINRDTGRKLTLHAGQQDTHFKLHPGESVRTPSILLVEWSGRDRASGHNQLRRLMVAHYLPRIDGQVAMPPVAATAAYVLIFDTIAKQGKNPLDVLPTLDPNDLNPVGLHGLPSLADSLNAVSEQSQLDYIDSMPQVGIEAYWLDAGWFEGGWPSGAGNWDPDPQKFPHGLKPLGDAAHAHGMKFLLWFEPERVVDGTLIAKEHPDWVLHVKGETPGWNAQFNFGIPAARQWMTDFISHRIDEWGIGIYRQDNNNIPLHFWRAADASDRQGITENHDIEGFYAMWDALLQKHPKLEIDNANWQITGSDIELMKRSVESLSRTQVDGFGIPFPEADQAQTEELSQWIPLNATLLHSLTPYAVRSAATTGVGFGLDLRSSYIPRDQLRKAVAEIKALRPYWLGDFYPLTPVTIDDRVWCAWQFDRPDLDSGYAVFFRRPKSTESTYDAVLQGLAPGANYEVTFAETYDVKETRVLTSAELGKLRVKIDSAPGVLLVRYRKLKADR
jgi:alpha-galactosidase